MALDAAAENVLLVVPSALWCQREMLCYRASVKEKKGVRCVHVAPGEAAHTKIRLPGEWQNTSVSVIRM